MGEKSAAQQLTSVLALDSLAESAAECRPASTAAAALAAPAALLPAGLRAVMGAAMAAYFVGSAAPPQPPRRA